MKTKPKSHYRHPVRVLREAIGYNQTKFAALVGMSLDMLGSIETGRRSLTEKRASYIALRTGCSPVYLLRANDAFPRDPDDPYEAYDRESFKRWNKGISKIHVEERLVRRQLSALSFWLWSLLSAARLRDNNKSQVKAAGVERPSRRRRGAARDRMILIEVGHAVASALGDIAEEHKLDPELRDTLDRFWSNLRLPSGVVARFGGSWSPDMFRIPHKARVSWRVELARLAEEMRDNT